MLHDINFQAEIRDIFDAKGNRISREYGRGVYRTDTDELISICGPKTHLIQHSEVVDPVLGQLDAQGYDIEFRAYGRSDLYGLAGRKKALVSTMLADNGAVMRTNIITGDYLEVTSPTGFYTAKGPDTNLFRFSLMNSHNAKLAVHGNASYERIICENGMTQPTFQANTYGKHTVNFEVAKLRATLSKAVEMMDADAVTFQRWATTHVHPKTAELLLQKTVARLPNKPNGDANFSETLVNRILAQFAQEDQTVWGLYNAVTWWQTHSEFRAGGNPVTATIGRESKVAHMLRSAAWKAVTA